MTELTASLRFADLAAMIELLMSLSSTGRLQVTSGEWVAELRLRDGRIIAVSLGQTQGVAALESIAIGLFDGALHYTDDVVAADCQPVLPADMQLPYLKRLSLERARIEPVIGSLQMIPRLIEGATDARTLVGSVTVSAASLQLVPSLVYGHTLNEIARRRGLARTLRGVYGLVRAGLVRLEDEGPSGATFRTCGNSR